MNVEIKIVVEGRTELRFVKSVLAPYLGAKNIFCTARIVETSRSNPKGKVFRGGMRSEYVHLKRDLKRWMKEDQKSGTFFSTMIDLYRLPKKFPAYEQAKRITDPFAKIVCLENALKEDLNHPRFIPYIQLHEFEALLLCDPQYLTRRYPERMKEVTELTKVCAGFASPDMINDGQTTAPSKRIIEKIPEYEYEKAFAGPLVAEYIGIEMLKKCRHFSEWLEKLERLAHP